MKITYTTLLEVLIRHDYYYADLDEDGIREWPENYDIGRDLAIVPTAACRQLLRNYNIVFKATPAGFHLYARVLPSEVAAPGNQQSFAFLEPTTCFTFLIKLKNPHFLNFTNLRLNATGKPIYYFSNRSGHASGGIPYLSHSMRIHNNPPPPGNQYYLGDLVLNNARTTIYEAISNPDNSVALTSINNWQEIDTNNARYVTALDRIGQLGPNYTFSIPNDHPDEPFFFQLIDEGGTPVPLGNIPNTNFPQSQATAPPASEDTFIHRLHLGSIPTGKYTLRISHQDDREVYLLDPLQHPDAFGVIELFASVSNADLRFVEYLPGGDPEESVLRPKTYQLRFKNRQTYWRYFRPDQTQLGTEPLRRLSHFHTGLSFGGALLPDPDASLLHFERDPVSQEISKIFSDVYLNEQY